MNEDPKETSEPGKDRPFPQFLRRSYHLPLRPPGLRPVPTGRRWTGEGERTAPHEAYELILDPFISFPFRFLTAAPVGHSPFRYARSVPSSLRGVRNGNGDDERRETAGKMTILTTFLSPLFLISFILYHFGRSPVTPSAQRMKRMR